MSSLSIITTTQHNIGDDFVREGIIYLLRSAGCKLPVELIHKHSPVTSVHGLESIRNNRISKFVEPVARRLKLKNRIDQAKILVQSGAPIYWCHENGPQCQNNEWYTPLVRKRFIPKRNGRLFLNLAGGSCQKYHSNGSEVLNSPKCLRYIQEFYDACDLTILRDELARKMLNLAGRDARVLPCTSIFARDQLNIRPEPGEYIVLNFMENGAHYTFGQDIDGALWRRQFIELAAMASKMGRVVISCHNQKEKMLAKELVPDFESYLIPNNYKDYMNFYKRAKWGILNRVHGGFMMASFGRPVAIIGNDSRALMIDNLNLKSYFIGDIKSVGLDHIIEDTRSRCATYEEESEDIRRKTKQSYLNELSKVI